MQQVAGYEVVQDLPGRARERCFRARPVGSRANPTYLIRRPDDAEADALLASASAQQKLSESRARYWAAIHAQGRDDEGAYVVTDHYRRSAEWLIQQSVELKPAGLYRIASCVVAGLRELQQTSTRAHGNLQPANILISGRKSMARERIVLSDPAPDDASGSTEYADDFRALGRLIFELASHVRFNELDEFPIAPKRFEKLGKHAGAWRQLCSDLLDPDPGHRPADLDELYRRLKAIRPRSRKLPIAAALMLLVAGGGGFFVWKKLPFKQPQVITRDQESDRERWKRLCADYQVLEKFVRHIDEQQSDRRKALSRIEDLGNLTQDELKVANPQDIAGIVPIAELAEQWGAPQSSPDGIKRTRDAIARTERMNATTRKWENAENAVDYLETELTTPGRISTPNTLASNLNARLSDIVSAAKNWRRARTVGDLLRQKESIDAGAVKRLDARIRRLERVEKELPNLEEEALKKIKVDPSADLAQLETVAASAESFAIELKKIPAVKSAALDVTSAADADRFEQLLLAVLQPGDTPQIAAALQVIQNSLSTLTSFRATSVKPLGDAFDAPFRQCSGRLLANAPATNLKALSESITAWAADATLQTHESLKRILDWTKTRPGTALAGALAQSAGEELKDSANYAALGAGLKRIAASIDQIELSAAQIAKLRTTITQAGRKGVIGALPGTLDDALKSQRDETLQNYAKRARDLQALAAGWATALADKDIDLDTFEQVNSSPANKPPSLKEYASLLELAPKYKRISAQTVTELLKPVEQAKAALEKANVTDAQLRARAEALLKVDLSGGWTDATKPDRLKAVEALCKKLTDLKQEIELGNYGAWQLTQQNRKFGNSSIQNYWAKLLPVCAPAPPAAPGEAHMKQVDRLAVLLLAFDSRMNEAKTQAPGLPPNLSTAFATDESAMRATALSEALKSLGAQLPGPAAIPEERACEEAQKAFDAQLAQTVDLIKDHARILVDLENWPSLAGDQPRAELFKLYEKDSQPVKSFTSANTIAGIRSRAAVLKALADTPDERAGKWWETSAGNSPNPEVVLLAWVKLTRAPRAQFSNLTTEKAVSEKLEKLLADASAPRDAKGIVAKLGADRRNLWVTNFKQAGPDDVDTAIGSLDHFCGKEESVVPLLSRKAQYDLALHRLKQNVAPTNISKAELVRLLEEFSTRYMDVIAQAGDAAKWVDDAKRAQNNQPVTQPGGDWPMEDSAKDSRRLQWSKPDSGDRLIRRKLNLKRPDRGSGLDAKYDSLDFVRVSTSGVGDTYLCTTELSLGNFIGIADIFGAWGTLARKAALPAENGRFTDNGRPLCGWTPKQFAPSIEPGSQWLRGLTDAAIGELKRRPNLISLFDAPTNDYPLQYLSPLGAEQVAHLVGCRLPSRKEWQDAWTLESQVDNGRVRWNLRGKNYDAMRSGAKAESANYGALDGVVMLSTAYDKSGDLDALWSQQLDRPAAAGSEYGGDVMPFARVAPDDQANAGIVFKHLRGNVAEFATNVPRISPSAGGSPAANIQYYILGGSSLSRPQRKDDAESWYNGKLIKSDPVNAQYMDVGVRLACTFGHTSPRDLVLAAKYLPVR